MKSGETVEVAGVNIAAGGEKSLCLLEITCRAGGEEHIVDWELDGTVWALLRSSLRS